MKWLNENAGVISCGEQFEPVLENGHMVRGRLLNGEFIREENGPDILHRAVPNQECLPDNHPKIIAYLARVNGGLRDKPI